MIGSAPGRVGWLHNSGDPCRCQNWPQALPSTADRCLGASGGIPVLKKLAPALGRGASFFKHWDAVLVFFKHWDAVGLCFLRLW